MLSSKKAPHNSGVPSPPKEQEAISVTKHLHEHRQRESDFYQHLMPVMEKLREVSVELHAAIKGGYIFTSMPDQFTDEMAQPYTYYFSIQQDDEIHYAVRLGRENVVRAKIDNDALPEDLIKLLGEQLLEQQKFIQLPPNMQAMLVAFLQGQGHVVFSLAKEVNEMLDQLLEPKQDSTNQNNQVVSDCLDQKNIDHLVIINQFLIKQTDKLSNLYDELRKLQVNQYSERNESLIELGQADQTQVVKLEAREQYLRASMKQMVGNLWSSLTTGTSSQRIVELSQKVTELTEENERLKKQHEKDTLLSQQEKKTYDNRLEQQQRRLEAQGGEIQKLNKNMPNNNNRRSSQFSDCINVGGNRISLYANPQNRKLTENSGSFFINTKT